MSVHKFSAKDVGRDGQAYDVIGIGFDPANIALAVALEELRQVAIGELATSLFINGVSYVA
jgi:lysine/ornithine N-monooxygenase